MDLLDAVIILLGLSYAFSGYRRGMSWVGLSLVGLFIGIIFGAVVAPWLAHKFISPGSANTKARALTAVAIFLFFIFTLQGLGAMIGLRMRVKVLRTRFVHWDSAGGAAVGFLGVIVASWYVGITFANSAFLPTYVVQQIRTSAIIHALYDVAPTVPGPVAALTRIITSPDNFSGAFSDVNPNVQIPALVHTPGVTAAVQDTYKVVSTITDPDCAGVESGSGWPINPTHIVTNAHVVAGGDHVDVISPSGTTQAGRVVFFDAQTDLAVIYVPGAAFTPLHLATSDPQPQTIGAVIGYPAGGDEQVSPAAVAGTESARSSDIYSSSDVIRTIEVLRSHIVPGNSGGPIVDTNGTVIGVVFAASTTREDEGYALAQSQINSDLSAGENKAGAVSTQTCVNS